MKKLALLATLVFPVMFSTEGWSLPPCPGSPSNSFYTPSWTGCFGTYTTPSGDKYVGEWKDGKEHGQGTKSYAGGENYVTLSLCGKSVTKLIKPSE